MADMMTNQERLEIVEQKLDDVLEIVRPKEAKTEPVSNKEIAEKIDELQSQVVNLTNQTKIQDVIHEDSFVAEDEEIVSESDKKFNTRRSIFMLASLLVTGGLSLVFWFNFLPLFAICFGVFFGLGFQALVLVFDEFTLQGNSLKRISKNAIGSAIYLLVVAFSIWSGVQVGNSLISDRSQSEEYRQPTATERQHTAEPSTNTGDSEE